MNSKMTINLKTDMRSFKNIFENFSKGEQKTNLVFWIFAVIFTIGILVRTYNFREWLQFSPDQARDAFVVSDAIKGLSPLPLLGPQAGNTKFKMGPLYYEMQYLSARLFGDTPQAMAYPDLFFSILALPMLFLFLRKYFNLKISLFLTGVMSISYFAIEISRFASNPNSIPFFSLVFLYSLLEIMQKQSRKRTLVWYSLLGLSMGVGIQLHTILVFTMPAVAGLVLVLLWKKKTIYWKGAALTVLFFLLMNIGQLASEIRTGGDNSSALLKSVLSRSDQRRGFPVNDLKNVISCQIESGIYFISSLQENRECGKKLDISFILAKTSKQTFFENVKELGIFFLGVVFLIGGHVILWKKFFNESNQPRKNFLGLLAVYNLIALLVLLPVAGEVEIRYFVVLMMIPFVLLGLWIDFFEENSCFNGASIGVLASILIFLNLYADYGYFLKYANGEMSDKKISVLGEILPVANYISDNKSASSKDVIFYGSKNYRKRFYKPLSYLLSKKDVGLEQKKLDYAMEGEYAFYVSAKLKKNDAVKGGEFADLHVENVRQFKNIAIYKLIK